MLCVFLQDGLYMHYEKLGVGSNRGFEYTNLNLLHNQLYFFNFHVVNSLGFTNILTSDPILTDFTPPTPTSRKLILTFVFIFFFDELNGLEVLFF